MSRRRSRSAPRAGRALTLLLLLAATGIAPIASAAEDGQAALHALQAQLAEVQTTLRQLTEENRSLREEQKQLAARVAQLTPTPSSVVTPAPAIPSSSPAAPSSNVAALPNASALPAGGTLSPTPTDAPVTTGSGLFGTGLRLWGYGEVYYTDPVNDRSQSQFDLARAVFGIGYQFDPRTEFNSEYEVEHAVA